MKKTFILLALSLLILSLSACTAPEETSSSDRLNQSLNIGAISSVDAIPIIIADEQGFFETEGLTVNFQSFKSAKDRDAAFQSGNLDGIICDQIAVSLYQNAGFDVKITGVTDGDFLLIANDNSNVESFDDLMDKSIAISEKTVIEYTLDQLLIKNNIDPNSVEKSMVPPVPTRLEMLRNNKVDVALLPDPFATLALNNNGVLLGSAMAEGFYPSVTAFKQVAIDEKSDAIKAFYKAYNRSVKYINDTPITEYEDFIIERIGYPEEMRGQINLPTFRENELPSLDDVQSVLDWVKDKDLIDKDLKPSDLLNDIGI